MSLIWDIETDRLPDDQLAPFIPEFTPPPHPGEFDPSSVKLGNIKDEAKRAAKIEECRAAHAAAVANYDATVEQLKANHLADFLSRAALSPVTGQVLAIGFMSEKGAGVEDGGGCEEDLLNRFWARYCKMRAAKPDPRKLVGCNIFGFDLPFLIRRSWILKVDIPATVRVVGNRWFDPVFVDLRDVWLCGQKWGECESSLGMMAKALGVGEKNGDGAEFGKLWREDRPAAVNYLLNDLVLTAKVAERLGVS